MIDMITDKLGNYIRVWFGQYFVAAYAIFLEEYNFLQYQYENDN
jgi:hypothetical protein